MPNLSAEEADEIIVRSAQLSRENYARRDTAQVMKAVKIRQPTQDQIYEAERLEASRREIIRRGRINDLRRDSGIPARYAQARLDDLSDIPESVRQQYSEASDRLKLITDHPAIIALLGKRGTGKTHMACAVAHEFTAQCRSAKYLDALDYLSKLKATYGKGGGNESEIERSYLRPKLLVLDEMHERGETDWEDRMLTRLVNKRYASEVATILISNQTADEFAIRIGSSILDRIRDDGGLILCDWDSLRGRIG